MDKKELVKREAQDQIKNYTKKLREINKDEKMVVERYNEGVNKYCIKSGPYLRRSIKRYIASANLFLSEDCNISSWTPVFEVKPLKKNTKFFQKYQACKNKDGWCWFSDLCRTDYRKTKDLKYFWIPWRGMRKSGTLAHQVYGKHIISRKSYNPKTERIARQFRFINPPG